MSVSRRVTAERGSVLILMPALVLVLLLLGAIAVDSATAYLAHRQLQDFTASAADQAAIQALDKPAFYSSGSDGEGGQLVVDADAAADLVQQLAAHYTGGGVTITSVTTSPADDGQGIRVTATGDVREIFGPAVGGHKTVELPRHLDRFARPGQDQTTMR